MKSLFTILIVAASAFVLFLVQPTRVEAEAPQVLVWNELPPLPNELGVAGPFAGVHLAKEKSDEVLIVAGGANFPRPVWENEKVWHDRIHVLTRKKINDQYEYTWKDGGTLPRPLAYGVAVSTDAGVICMGGNDATTTYQDVFLLSWNARTGKIAIQEYPSLPKPCAFGAATLIGSKIYLAGGQEGLSLDSAMSNFWMLDLGTQKDRPKEFQWRTLESWPGPSRALNLTVRQHNGFHDCVYVMSGRRHDPARTSETDFLTDVWEYSLPTRSWRKRTDVPRCLMAGTAIGVGQSHIAVLGGDNGELFGQANTLKDNHPGFVKEALGYHTITDTWIPYGKLPANHVTTIAVPWGQEIIIPSGEVRPRVRSPKVWSVGVEKSASSFGTVNYCVLFGYLAAMVGVGVFFTAKNKNTDDFFRGGKQIPWWAAGCSIFATMLSSLTFTGVPSKAYAQDWVYSIGNFMIPVVAIIAVFVALPFFRRIDATSAYEYLEKRFSRHVRWFGSASFTIFHVFRMALVMSLTGLALAVATPLTPMQSVLLMGVLSIIYCALGGIEAVIWTDTIQTFVLFGGAVFAVWLIVSGVDGGFASFVSEASAADKFTIAHHNWDVTSSQIALWVIVLGAAGQNLSSYTADQTVVQRYMTTADERLAARSIWTNAILTIPATVLFFGIGSALFVFYRSHPEKLDPTITTDQIFPLFIACEMPVGIAGLIVAGVFAAAQSTVSTSMNSTATAVVTDFLRPLNFGNSEATYLKAARWLTFLFGVMGTLLALVFVDPAIKSLFDSFIKVIGTVYGCTRRVVRFRSAHDAGECNGCVERGVRRRRRDVCAVVARASQRIHLHNDRNHNMLHRWIRGELALGATR